MADPITLAFATSVTEGVVSSLVDKLTNAAIEEVQLLRGVRGEIKYIIDELEFMKAFLRSAEDQQDSNELAKIWVKQVQELAYDAEDCIDEFKLHLNRPDGHGLSSALRSCLSLLSTLGARHQIATQIRDIQSRVKEASERVNRYRLTMPSQGLAPGSHVISSYAPHDPRMSALFVEKKDLIGMDEPKRELIGWLTEENNPQLGVISVVGMGGLGKTTLVKRVYESEILGQLFNCRIWITVSNFHTDDLLRDMMRQLPISDEDRRKHEQLRSEKLIEKLREHLNNKKYLIVFDDIWTIAAWESIKLALPGSTNGSRVMVTTRIERVAETCRFAFPHGRIYELPRLSHKQSWELFCNRLFKDSGGRCPPELKDPSEAILKKCGGLPLAIVTIAGLLSIKRNKTKEEWKQVYDKLGYELETNPSLEVVKQILNLSYYDLPHSLRPCFLYLSKYPEDYKIKRRQVVELWAAEGLAIGTQNMSAEEVAEKYFDEFINRSMIQSSKIRWDGKVKSCTVHDVMLEVMVSKSREQNLLISFLADDEHETVQQKIRRLSANTRIKSTDLSHVRSITYFRIDDTAFIHSRPRLLRVLDLQRIEMLSRQQLKWISELIHLKYLRLHFSYPYSCNIPKSWENLRQLETLDVEHVLWRGGLLFVQRVTKLQKLRHLRGHFVFLPKCGIGNLQSLHTLDSVHCEEGQGHVIRELGKLTQLRQLSLVGLESEHISLLSASLSKLNSCLRSLKLSSLTTNIILESISSPPLQLQELKLGGLLQKFPSWVALLKDVAKITLYDTKLKDDAIQVLQNLPNLIYLKLMYGSFAEENMCFFVQEGFLQLKILILRRFGLVRFKERAMPNLARLTLSYMSIEEANFGIEHLVQLKELEIFYCRSTDDVLDELLQTAKEHLNQPRVTIRRK